ncbi:hypothetical protein VB774_03935 [Pseudanabaena galeata UHCC 0370]|uniref:Uncharacterized protein n=1 Tax=Pseudanabaena galeata UHCC 0370 TaxID=3110310 RepID=A0ABU5TFF6_9CYAN|nr:hypothetical protein [Pseudanabaena galeata]MEA5476763.1 hypothetical protein [Pseudanabaena galeata UHCC 0370]
MLTILHTFHPTDHMQFYQGKSQKLKGKITVGAQHYRQHLRISPRSPNGNAIAQTPQRSHNLSAGAKRV